VRNTLEGLVARGQVQRLKQGGSVFYALAPSTAVEPTGTTTDVETDTGTRQDDLADEAATLPR